MGKVFTILLISITILMPSYLGFPASDYQNIRDFLDLLEIVYNLSGRSPQTRTPGQSLQARASRSPALQARARASKPCLPSQGPQARASGLRPQARASTDGRTDRWTDGWTDGQIIPCSLQDIVPLGLLPCLQSENLGKNKSRARVLLTIY